MILLFILLIIIVITAVMILLGALYNYPLLTFISGIVFQIAVWLFLVILSVLLLL